MPVASTHRAVACGALTLLALLVPAHPSAAVLPGGAEPVLSGLNGPVDFALLPDGSIWWLEYYTGNFSRIDLASGERQVLFHVEPVVGGERGVVGLGVNQKSADAGTFFIYYTVAEGADDKTGGVNHLSRIDDGKETVLLTTTAAVRHNGGRIVILPDDTLFVSIGENDKGAPAQDPDSLLGKILHIHQDGSAVAGNPHDRVWSLGHRNVYGLAYDPATKRLFATENSNAERDEVNEILPGRNYGWPFCEGTIQFAHDPAGGKPVEPITPCTDPAFTPPIGEFSPTGTLAPTGAAILDGHLYWASWNQGSIHRMDEMGDGTWKDTVVYQYGGRINDLEAGLDGKSLYYSNWTSIVRVPMTAPDGVAKLKATSAQPASTGLATHSGGSEPKDGDDPFKVPSPAAPLLALGLASLALVLRRRRA